MQRLYLLVNLALLAWGTGQMYNAATWTVPDAMKNQSCCKGDYTPMGECCEGQLNPSDEDKCYQFGSETRVARDGVLDMLTVYRSAVAVVLIALGLVPYHPSEPRNLGGLPSIMVVTLWWTLVPCAGLFVFSNIILGYSRTVPCQYPDTRQFEMLRRHSPYDFGLLVLMAWVGPGVAIGCVVVKFAAGTLFEYGRYCIHGSSPPPPTPPAPPPVPTPPPAEIYPGTSPPMYTITDRTQHRLHTLVDVPPPEVRLIHKSVY